MKKKYYILTTIFSFLILLVATVPAQLFVAQIKQQTGVSLLGVSGTLWNGKAVSIVLNQKINLQKNQWSFNFLPLIMGKLSFNIKTELLNNPIQSNIAIGITGKLYVNELTAKFKAKDIVTLAKVPLVMLTGNLVANIKEAYWEKGDMPPIAIGNIKWNKASVSISETVALGDISVILKEQNQHLNAQISNRGGDIKITGMANLLAKNQYTTTMKFKPEKIASNDIKASLSIFAKPQNDGSYLFEQKGSLKQLGL